MTTRYWVFTCNNNTKALIYDMTTDTVIRTFDWVGKGTISGEISCEW